MKTRLAVLLLVLLGAGGSLFAQNPTAVSGTITDPNGVAYFPATVTACLTPVTTSPIVNGQHVNPNEGTNYCAPLANTSSTGSFSLSLFPNSAITPGGTQWRFTVTALGAAPPAGKGSQTFQVSITISGTSQDVGATLSASAPALLNSGGGGISSVSSLPATCTPGVTQPVSLSAPNTILGVVYGASTVFYCDTTNHLSPVSQGSGAAPTMGFYLGPQCPPSNSAFCFNTPANTQQANACTWTTASPTVTCLGQLVNISAAVAANVATYTIPSGVPATWVAGNSITVITFAGADAFFNQTCTISSTTATTILCPLVHANASSTTPGTMTNSNTAAGPFVAADAGKRGFGYQTCTAFLNYAAANNNQPITTSTALTISTFTNPTSINLSGNAGQTATLTTQGGCFIWGTPDDAGAAAIDAAMNLASSCPKLFLSGANYFYTTPHHFMQPPACVALGDSFPGGNAGNMLYAAGYELEGRGTGPTNFYLPPGFPESGTCTNGKSKIACFVITTQGAWKDLQINGGGNFNAPNMPAAANLLEVNGPASLDKFTCVNFGSNFAGTTTGHGLGLYLWPVLNQVNWSACGPRAIGTNVSSVVTATNVSVDNYYDRGWDLGTLVDYYTQNPFIFSKYNLVCYSCYVFGATGMKGTAVAKIDNTAMRVKLYSSRISPLGIGNTETGSFGYICRAPGGCVLDMEDTFFDMSVAGGTAQTAILCQAACTNTFLNSIVKGTAGTNTISDAAGSTEIDMGGNVFGNTETILGTLIAKDAVKGSCTGVVTASSTLGLYNTGANATPTVTTCTNTNIGLGTPVQGARTLYALSCKSSAAGVSASSVCIVLKNGANVGSCSMNGVTTCSTGLAVALADGDLVSLEITTGVADTLANVKAIAAWF